MAPPALAAVLPLLLLARALAVHAAPALPPATFRATSWFTTACGAAPAAQGGNGSTCLQAGGRPTTGCHEADARCTAGQRTADDLRVFHVGGDGACLRYLWAWRCAHVARAACGPYWCDVHSRCVDNTTCVCPSPARGDPVTGICACDLNLAFNGTGCVALQPAPPPAASRSTAGCGRRPPLWAFILVAVLLLLVTGTIGVVAGRRRLRDRQHYRRAMRAAQAFGGGPSLAPPATYGDAVPALYEDVDGGDGRRAVLHNPTYDSPHAIVETRA